MHSGLKFTCDTHAVQITTAKQLRQIMREDVKFECEDCAIVAKGAIDILKKQKVCKVCRLPWEERFFLFAKLLLETPDFLSLKTIKIHKPVM